MTSPLVKLWVYDTMINMSAFSDMMRTKIIAEELDVSINTLIFKNGEHGKPFLKDYPNINFSISHTGTFWAMALQYDSQALGLDIERHKSRKYMESIMEYYFHPDECATYKEILSLEERMNYFYRLWTKKEAYAKYLGKGLHYNFSSESFISYLPEKVKCTTETKRTSCAQTLSLSLVSQSHRGIKFIGSLERPLVWDIADKIL